MSKELPTARPSGKTVPPGNMAAMGTLFILHDRYFQARLGERDLLQLVEVLRLLARAVAQNLVGEREETAGRTDFLSVGSGRESACRPPSSRGCLFPTRSRTHKAN